VDNGDVEFRRWIKRALGRAICLGAAIVISHSPVLAQDAAAPMPSFAELEAAGAVIGEIRIQSRNIFDLDDPRENGPFYRFGNAIHVPTRPGLLRSSLLFKSGERVSAQKIEESERILRTSHNVFDVSIRAVSYREGVVDIEVTTRDSWSLVPGLKLSREGGVNTGAFGLKESNFLGTGLLVGYAYESEFDRSGTEFSLGHANLFGTWTGFEYNRGNFDDGSREKFRLERPFYALDARWAAGVSAATVSRIDSVYSGERLLGQYRRIADDGEVYAGWSSGLVGRWAQRYSVGVQYEDDVYRADPTLPPAPVVPADMTIVAPFIRYEIVEDQFRKVRNRDRVERVEYLPVGLTSRLQLGRALTSLGSTRELWTYAAELGGGVELAGDRTLLGNAYSRGRYGGGAGGGENRSHGASGKLYYPQGAKRLFFASAAVDAVHSADPSEQLLLGGSTGLRGYPLRYQTGTERAVMTLEQRFYTDWFPLRLFRVGAAVFYDVGRSWGDSAPGAVNRGWVSDAGVGLRIFSDRSSSGRVLHIDLAFPLDSDAAAGSWQLYLKSRAAF
jgi:hypothetical protein